MTTVVILFATILSCTLPFTGVRTEVSLVLEMEVVYAIADDIAPEGVIFIFGDIVSDGLIITTTVLFSPL